MQTYKHTTAARRILSVLLAAGSCLPVLSQTFPVQTLLNNGNRPNRIKLAYLGDGYTSTQQTAFITNATAINNALFGQAPFSNYKNFFNAYAVQVTSAQTGAKHPGTASDEASSGGQPVANPNNFIGSTFDYAAIHRLLVPNGTTANNLLAANVADYNQALVVVNSTYYGGSGGALATSSINTSANEIAIHEIGHSFAGLADEYWAGTAYAAEKPNMTQNNNTATVKWSRWIGINGIGIYPYGSTAPQNQWFRPHQNCKMQLLGVPFCAVCSERIIDRIHQLVNMIDSYLPASTNFSLTNTNPVSFSVTHLQTNPATIRANWYVNGALFASNQASVSIPAASFRSGSNTVRVDVVDNTALSKSYQPAAGYVNSITWTVNRSIPRPANPLLTKKDNPLPVMESTVGLVVSPNPLDDYTTLYYRVPQPQSMISIMVYNTAGSRIAVLKQEAKAAAGPQTLRWNTSKLPPGQYLLEVTINGVQAHKQVTKQ